MTFVLEAKKGKNLIEKLKKRSLTICEERSANSRITNEQELYNAVCREVAVYEDHEQLVENARNLLDRIAQYMEGNGLFTKIIDRKDSFELLKILYENWEDINWEYQEASEHLFSKIETFFNTYDTENAFQTKRYSY